MSDMRQAIIPKSDQLNADDLIAGPMTIRITGVTIKSGEQPVSIHFEGDNGKPYKCCKSMARILVSAWGADSKKYVGRSLTLYRDPAVKWAGLEVGGIRISHMSDIADDMTMALTVTRANKKPFTVRPLKQSATPAPVVTAEPSTDGPGAHGAADHIDNAELINMAPSLEALANLWRSLGAMEKGRLLDAKNKRKAELEASGPAE